MVGPVTSELIPPRNLCCCGSENETKVEREHSPPRRAGRGGVDATSVKRCEASLYWSGRGGQFGETRRIAEARAVDRLDRAAFKFIGRSRAPLKIQGTVCPFLPSFAVRSTPTCLDRGCICCSQNCHRQTGRSSGNPSEFLLPFCR